MRALKACQNQRGHPHGIEIEAIQTASTICHHREHVHIPTVIARTEGSPSRPRYSVKPRGRRRIAVATQQRYGIYRYRMQI